MSKDYSLSLRGEAFNSLCADFDTTLRDVLAGMIETEQNTGEINIKVKITLRAWREERLHRFWVYAPEP